MPLTKITPANLHTTVQTMVTTMVNETAVDSASVAILIDSSFDNIVGGTGITYTSASKTFDITNTGVSAGSYGSASLVPILTINAQGQVTSASTTSVAGVSSTSFDSASGIFTISTADGGSFNTTIADSDFTTKRARESISATGSLSYNSGTGVMSYTQGSTDTITEGSSNLYFTDARARAALSASGDLSYNSSTGAFSATTYKTANFNTDLAASDTNDLSEGSTNLYYTNTRSRSAISLGTAGSQAYNSTTGVFTIPGTTDHITEGSNLFYTNARADARVNLQTGANLDLSSKSTSDLSEGTNLYYTNARADARVNLQTGSNLDLSSKSTSDLSEGSNLYYTTTRGNSDTASYISGNRTYGNITTTGYIAGPASFTIDPAAVGDNTGTVIIAGNLTVNGTTTTVNSTTVDIGDNILVLNADETGVPSQNAGIEIERGTSTNVQFIWDEANDRWSTVNQDLALANLVVNGTVDGRDVAADGTKLDGIEASADVTDATNVAAAGAAMTSGATFTGDVTFTGASYSATWDKSENHLKFNDNAFLRLGNASDLELYHNGSNSVIGNYTGTFFIVQYADDGNIIIRSDDGAGGVTDYFKGEGATGEAHLLYYGNEKLNTISQGVYVTGNIVLSGTVDGRNVNADGQKLDGIEASADVTDATNVAAAGAAMTTGATFTGDVTVEENLVIGDDSLTSNEALVIRGDNATANAATIKVAYGNNDNYWLMISDGSSQSTILARNRPLAIGTRFNQNVSIVQNNTTIQSVTPTGISVTGNITVSGTVDGRDVATDGTKLDTVATSATANPNAIDNVVEDTTPQLGGDLASNGNNILFADNDKAIFGAGSDLQIYHNGTDSFIDETNATGWLYIRGNNTVIGKYTGETYFKGIEDGAVELYYDNSKKLATTSTGIDVTGTVTATSFSGDGSGLTGITSIPAGVIVMWSGSVASIPTGWYLCDGNNGTPNLTGRFVVHADADTSGTYAPGATGGANTVALATGELPSHAHNVGNLANTGAGDHSHNFNANTGNSGNHSHSGSTSNTGSHYHTQYWSNQSGGNQRFHQMKYWSENHTSNNAMASAGAHSHNFSTNAAGDHSHNFNANTGNSGNHAHTISGSTGAEGSGTGHENRPPYYALAYIMKG